MCVALVVIVSRVLRAWGGVLKQCDAAMNIVRLVHAQTLSPSLFVSKRVVVPGTG